MTRGKYGAKAAKRQETQALEAEISKLRHALARTEKERDEALDEVARKVDAHSSERAALMADRDNATSPRVLALEAWLSESRKGHDELADQIKREKRLAKGAMDALVEHMRAEHGWGDNVVGRLTRMLNSTDATIRRRSIVLTQTDQAVNYLSATGLAAVADLDRAARA